MIISRGRRYIFVHIPKTAGTSMALALEARAMKDDIMLGDTPKARKRRRRLQGAEARGRLWKHATLTDIDGLVRREDIEDAFCFTLVRNPWDRLVSYYHWLREQSFAHAAVALAKQLSFKDFLAHPQTRASFEAMPYGAYMRTAWGAERCDAFIRLEHFQGDVAPLEDHLGFGLRLPQFNRSNRDADYRGYYDAESQALVETLCAEDIARFGYRFD